MELEKRKVITLRGKTLTGLVTIEGHVNSKDPADILVTDIPGSQVYSVKSAAPITELVKMDDGGILVLFLNETKLSNKPREKKVIQRFIQLRNWLEENYEDLLILTWYLDKYNHVSITYSIIFDGTTFADVLKQVSDLLGEIKQCFGIE